MASSSSSSSSSSFLVLLITTLVFSHSIAKKTTSFRPKALILPVIKDTSTKHVQYLTEFRQRTPLVPVKLTLDLGGEFMWVDCDKGYRSSSYQSPRCRSAACNLARAGGCGECYDGPKPGCNNNTCSLLPYNPIAKGSTIGELAADVVSLQSTNGFNPGRSVSVPKLLFVCGSTSLTEGLPRGVTGVAGLGRKKIGLPSLFAAAFSFKRKFAVCLSSEPGTRGVVFFGNNPYALLPNHVVSERLVYTPLILNPVATGGSYFQGENSADYFIGVKSIVINGKAVKGINATLLSIDKEGNGGTKISTVEPYGVLQSSIYRAVLRAFVKTTSKSARVKSVAPFRACYNATVLGSNRVGLAVPQIDLVMNNKGAVWSIFGSNSLVEVRENVHCFAFVDGGLTPQTSIVIGAHQIENNLLEFDLAYSRLGFSSSLLFSGTTCANFNFTTVAY